VHVVSDPRLVVDVQHAPSLCYAMQQAAVRWLRRIRIENPTDTAWSGLQLGLSLEPVLAQPWSLRLDALPARASIEVPVPDLPLAAAAFANLVERQRADLVVTVDGAGQRLAEHRSTIDLLAYNEWPGPDPNPALLAAFVAPNHPALPPVLQDIAARLQQATGRSALDGYQSRDPGRALAIAAAVHDAVALRGITYVQPPPSFERQGQKVRTPEQVLGERLGTCLDLAVLYAALLEHAGLHPFLVLVRGHAFVGVWLVDSTASDVAFGPALELRKRLELGALVVVECTAACASNGAPFDAAVELARQRLLDDDAFGVAIDVAVARRQGIRPLPVRTQAYAPGLEVLPLLEPDSERAIVEEGAGAAAASGGDGAMPPDEVVAPPAPPPPKDRLEHWKQKLLDLSMFNRLLNFAETKKTVRLCAHELEALCERMQQGGRVRILPRPDLGAGDGDQARDLALASQRAGHDVVQDYLAEELRAGRLRAELDAEALDERLIEIFRHARTSLEESGANTLYLAIGFLKYFESRESEKPRRAPLLLLPLTVERTSVTEGVRFVLDDAEPRLNQTLLQFLQRDFELRVGLGELPPESEDGVDAAAVLDAFRRAVVAMPRWEVETTACIGFFSFTKYLMWLDLADRDGLLRSPVLQHLVERPGQGFAQDAREYARDELDDLDPAELLCPKDADSSQLAAVLAAVGGRSFVLEGPPGTGKSQTITNLIAQALATGRRVLFVAEKRAALEVVQRRLAEVGLGPFCLELHSQKSGPKSVLDQLRAALELGQRRRPVAWDQVAQELQQVRTQLNQLVHDLHRPREHGASVFAAMAELVPLRGLPRIVMPALQGAPRAAVEAAERTIGELAGAAQPIGVPCEAPWWGVQRTDWSPALQRQVEPAHERLQRATAALAAALVPFAESCGLTTLLPTNGPSRAQWQQLLGVLRLLRAPSLPPASWLRHPDWRSLEAELQQTVALGAHRDAAWSPLAERWRRELLGLDLDRLLAGWRHGAQSFVVLRWWRLRAPKRELQPVAMAGLGAIAEVGNDLAAAVQVRNEERTLLARAAAAQALGAHWRASLADWAQVTAWCQWVRELRQLLVQLVPGALAPESAALAAIAAQLDGLADGANVLPPRLGALQQAHDEFTAAHAAVVELLKLDVEASFGAASAPGLLTAIGARIERWRAAAPALRDHCAYRAAATAAAATGTEPLVAAHARGDVATGALPGVFRASFVEAWLDGVHRTEPELARFRGLDHERRIARFCELDQQAIRLAGQVIQARLCAEVPQLRDTTVASSELGILERELKKQRKHKPVRRLLAEIPGLLAKLAPCVLMSPLSVAQYLARGGQRFDLVVFDEASQIPMWDAVGAIGRGDSLVVVGDSKQLPPTSFFQRQAQGDEIGSEEIPEDLESVLDECGAAGLPRLHLDWHYRSRHESLIAFSNHHYYKNRLLTFPAPQAITPGLGVRSIKVAGVYDRAGSQQNKIEAEALVAEVKTRLLDPARNRQSLGIVTFSQAQQVLIEDLLDQARRENPELEVAFGTAGEPVFVKNLENVQGDERDVILFSICYGPDAQGRVYENYGPLNLQGGERRLNVAVTRARRELLVFTSVGPEQVAQRTQALGARHLRTFLDYAQRGTAALHAASAAGDPGSGTESPFETAVRDALLARGHEVHTQIGCSGYRIDLAVVDPQAPGRYLLGIECDGASYHSAATARDRDRLRGSVLKGLGWRLHRVWSTDFWQDPDGEIVRIEAAIAAAAAAVPRVMQAPVVAVVEVVAPAVVEPAAAVPVEAASEAVAEPPLDADGPRPFVAASLPGAGTPEEFQAAAALRSLRTQIEAVLQQEGPVVFDRLAWLTAAAWDLSRVTDRVRDRIRSALPPTTVADGDVLWADAAQRDTFRGFREPGDEEATQRPVEELPPVEIANAMCWLLRQHQALAPDDLAREAARCFGITRLGAVVKSTMAGVVEQMLGDGRLARDGEVLRLG
jgi:very-short-patch-repair endonuclease